MTETRIIPRMFQSLIFRGRSIERCVQFVGDSHRNFRTTSYGFFGQDSFKVGRIDIELWPALRVEHRAAPKRTGG